MKTLLLFLMIFAFTNANTQKQTITISKEKINPFDCEYTKIIDKDSGDTLYFILMSFKNMEYPSLDDRQYLDFEHNEDKDAFINDIDSAVSYLDNKELEMDWSKNKYRVSKYSGSKNVFVYAEIKRWTAINKNSAIKLSAWLKSINIGSDVINPTAP